MCIEVNGAGNAKYIPLINNKTYTDPTTGRMYNFKSDYYTSNYHGVVIAKAPMCNTATNNYRGEPTYFVSSTKTKPTLFNKSGNYVGDNDPYYYEMVISGGFNQFGENGELGLENIAQSDRIGQDSTIVIFFEQNDGVLKLNLTKSRDSENALTNPLKMFLFCLYFINTSCSCLPYSIV